MTKLPITASQLAELQEASRQPVPEYRDSVSTRDIAVARAERIRAGIRSLADLQQDIVDAYQARDWETLDYSSWESYVSAEFGHAMPRLEREERRELVVNLRAEGLSTRAIASATGTHKDTVRNDLSDVSGGENSPPDGGADAAPVTGLDGKQYTAQPMSQTRQEDQTEEEIEESRLQTKQKQRRPITDTTYESSRRLVKETEKFVRLLDDERLAKNRDQVANACADDLTRASLLITDALTQLQGEGYTL